MGCRQPNSISKRRNANDREKKMTAKLKDERGITLVVVLTVMIVLLSIVGAGLLFSGVNLKITSNYQAGAKAFYAADMGIQHGISLINTSGALPAFSLSSGLPSGLSYRSGTDPTNCTPQASTFVGSKPSAGYSLGSGTGYNTSGYTFYQYKIDVVGNFSATGSCAAGSAARVVEAQAVYGPVAQ
jgi:hypothetical protein